MRLGFVRVVGFGFEVGLGIGLFFLIGVRLGFVKVVGFGFEVMLRIGLFFWLG